MTAAQNSKYKVGASIQSHVHNGFFNNLRYFKKVSDTMWEPYCPTRRRKMLPISYKVIAQP